jgi:hypothetical protein
MEYTTDRYSEESSKWNENSGVRVSKANFEGLIEEMACDTSGRKGLTLPNSSALLAHPNLTGLDDHKRDFVRGIQLLEFLMKQTIFEIRFVNEVASEIAQDRTQFHFPQQLKTDALKIYTDEGYHAYYTELLASQLRSYYSVTKQDIQPYVDSHFDALVRWLEAEGRDALSLRKFALVLVSESQIVSDISSQLHDVLYEPIKALFREHMKDEVFHARYFQEALGILWSQLVPGQREIFSRAIVESMSLIGAPRLRIYEFSLSKLGYTIEDIRRMTEDIYGTSRWKVDFIRERMRPTVRVLQRCGLLEYDYLATLLKRRSYVD